jgi:hypothetical protein
MTLRINVARVVRASGQALVAAFCIAGAVGCSRSHDGEEHVGVSKSGLAVSQCQLGADCVLPFELPAAVGNDSLVAAGNMTVTVGDRAKILLEDERPGSLGNTGTGLTDIGSNARVGNVSARAGVTVRSNAIVSGTIFGSPISVQAGASAPNRRPAAAAPATMSLRIRYPNTTSGDRTLQPNQTLQLNPGRYGTLTVNQGARLRLLPGAYYLDTLQVESGGTVELDTTGGTEVVFIRNRFVQRGSLSWVGPAGDALFGVFGTDDVVLEGDTDATVIASAAQVIIGPANNQPSVTYDGTYFAKALLLRPDVRLRRKQISGAGAAIGGVTVVSTGAPNTTPPALPTTSGKTPRTYMEEVQTYIQNLKDSGYRGAPVAIAAHPDYRGAEPQLDPSISSQVPNPPRAPAPGSNDALVATAKPGVQQAYPETTPTYVDPPEPPSFCPLGADDTFPGTNPDGTPQGTGFDEKFGDPKSSPVPDFDGWFGGNAKANYGYDFSDGLFANLDGSFTAGFSVFGFPYDLVDFAVNGHTQTVRPAAGSQLTGHAHVVILNDTKANWDYAANVPPFHNDFCAGCGIPKLLPTDIEIPIAGIVTISFNAGLEAALPASFTLTENGPLFTFAPMFRVFAIVKASVGQGLRVGVEGRIDVLRVDAPARVGTKFLVNTSPSVCKATIQPTMDVKLKVSTLNGQVFLVVEVFAFAGYVELARWELFAWDGFSFDLPIKDFGSLLPGLDIPLAQSSCLLDTEGCKTTTPTRTIQPNELTPTNPAVNFGVAPAAYYDLNRAECQGQFLLEIPGNKLTGTTLQLRAVWNPTEAAGDDALCRKQRAVLNVFGRLTPSSPWEQNVIALRHLQGELNPATGLCEPKVVEALTPDADMPQNSVDIFLRPSRWTGGLRVAALPARACGALPLSMTVAEQF